MTPPKAGAPLAGIGILVTRPREQAAGLVNELRQLGARPVLFPALAILPPGDPAALRGTLNRLDRFHLAIFISPTAAQRGMAAVGEIGAWPSALPVAAIGKGTARALHELGIKAVLEPESGADSEHLLAQPQLQDMTGKEVVIFRGEGGREMLADTLHARGARVVYAECYRRGMPDRADAPSILARHAAGEIRAVTAYSGETLDNLFKLLGAAGSALLRETPLFVPHTRIAEHARALGITTVIDCQANQGRLIPCLVKYFTHD